MQDDLVRWGMRFPARFLSANKPSVNPRDYKSATDLVRSSMAIRRLMPVECERLQGFPDDWTAWGMKGNTQAAPSDSTRYKQCGNAVNVAVSTWLARQVIPAVQQMKDTLEMEDILDHA